MMRIIEQSYEDKVKMYMKCTKKELVSMLLSCHDIMNKSQVFTLDQLSDSFKRDIEKLDPYSSHAKWITSSNDKELSEYEYGVLKKTARRLISDKPTKL